MLIFINYALLFAAILLLVALGGCFSEHSGVINIGLEGIMVIGALGGALVMQVINPELPPIVIIAIVVIISMLSGAVYSLILAVASINFGADQTLVGTAMNMLATAMATVMVRAINAAKDAANVSSALEYGKVKKALFFTVGNIDFGWLVVLAIVILVIANIALYKTKFGLHLLACGENPSAAQSVGINVTKMRYMGVLISGALGGLGGITYITTGVSEWKFEYGVAGFGFLSLAVMIFGQWRPVRIALAALLFGVFRSLSNVYVAFDFLVNLGIPSYVYNMLPYVVSLIVLAITSKRSRAPKAEGIPFNNKFLS